MQVLIAKNKKKKGELVSVDEMGKHLLEEED